MKVVPFPEGWEPVKIKDLCDPSHGRQIGQKEVQGRKGQYPVYGSAKRGGGIAGYVDTFDHAGGRVTWVKYGPYAGSTAFREGKFSLTYLLGALRVKDEEAERVDVKFLEHSLGYEAPKYASPTPIPRLTTSTILEITIGLPPVSEQRKITALLDSVEEGVALTETAIGITEKVRGVLGHRSNEETAEVPVAGVEGRLTNSSILTSLDTQSQAYRKRMDLLKQLRERLAWDLLTGGIRFPIVP